LGVGLFGDQLPDITQQLDTTPRCDPRARSGARIRGSESYRCAGVVIDAVDELNIPDRILYLLDLNGSPVKPTRVDPWIIQAAKEAGRAGQVTVQGKTPDDKTLRLHAIPIQAGVRPTAGSGGDRGWGSWRTSTQT
jgi:hypothetical protein